MGLSMFFEKIWNYGSHICSLIIHFLIVVNWHAVMQFGGQHPGGVGVPAVGMAFPGYVAQPQLGLGNSEMTWYGDFFFK